MATKKGLLGINPDPIKLVPAAQRDVWFPRPGLWRCEHEDGRGRCTSRETRGFVLDPPTPTFLCEKHQPREED